MATDSELVEALGATALFSPLNRRSLKRVAEAAKIVKHDPGKELTTQGADGIAFHLILEGSATVSVAGRPGHSLGKGDYFGEISMIDGEPRSATIVVDTPMTTAALTAWEFRPLLNEIEITKSLLLALCQRIRASEQDRTA
jgi:CRP/FNR family transcriptional regulator, cyclic AMP receptor protein